MKIFIFFIFLFFTFVQVKAQNLFEYFPLNNGGLNEGASQMVKDSIGNIYFSSKLKKKIYIFNKNTNEWKSIQTDAIVFDMVIDKNNNLWLTTREKSLLKFDGNSIISMKNLLSKYTSTDDLMAYINCDDNNNLWIPFGPFLFKINGEKVIDYNADSLAFNKYLGTISMLKKSDKLIFPSYTRDSILIVNPDDINSKKAINIRNFDVEDSSYVENILEFNGEIYVTITKNLFNMKAYHKKNIYKLIDFNKLEKIKLNFIDTCENCYINKYIFDNNNYLIVFLTNKLNDDYVGQIAVFKNTDFVTLQNTPIVEENGIKMNYFKAFDLMLFNNAIYIVNGSLGLLKYYFTSHLIDNDELCLAGSDVWIHSSYPNPCKNFIKIDFYCSPNKFNELNLDLYNVLGVKIKSLNYSIVNYNNYNGQGSILINIENCPIGFNLISISVKNSVNYKSFVKFY